MSRTAPVAARVLSVAACAPSARTGAAASAAVLAASPAAAAARQGNRARRARAAAGRGRRCHRPRRCGWQSSGPGSSTRRPRWTRRALRSTAAGSAAVRATRPAPWRSRSCRHRPRPRETAGGRASATGRRPWRAPVRRRSRSATASPARHRWNWGSSYAASSSCSGVPARAGPVNTPKVAGPPLHSGNTTQCARRKIDGSQPECNVLPCNKAPRRPNLRTGRTGQAHG